MIVAICDDDQLQVEIIRRYLDEMDIVHGYDVFDSIEQLMFSLEERNRYDVLLMDIEWNQDLNGIDYAIKVNEKKPECQIIFLSNYTQYSQDIFRDKLNLCGFLMKPVDKEHFQMMLQRASKRILEASKKQLIVQTRKVSYVFYYYQILFLESVGHRVIIHTDQDEVVCYEKLNYFVDCLKSSFAKCHKSYLVNMNRIKRIVGTDLDVSKNIALTSLDCGRNNIASLNVTGCTALTELWCPTNKLTELELGTNTALTAFCCNENQLVTLDVTKNTLLSCLYCDANQLTMLDVSKNLALSYLSCESNKLTALDLTNNVELRTLECDSAVVVSGWSSN